MKTRTFRAQHSLISRTTALVLLAALVTPMFLGLNTVSAHTDRKPVAPAPEAAPPEPFMVYSPSSTAPIISGTFASVSSIASGVLALIKGPRVPEGLEQPDSVPAAVEPEPSAPAPPTPPAMVNFDFDGDGTADLARRHPSTAEWKIKNSSSGNYTTVTVGSGSATLAPGDFDGDGKTDAAVFSSGTWTIKRSSDGQTQTVSFGTSGDKPVVGDYDGDDISDIAVFRPSTSTWWVSRSSDSQTVSSTFGTAGDITVEGDYDGDGKTDIAVFRPSSGDWHVSGSTSGYFVFHWGIASDIPVPADYDGDSKTDFAVYRGTNGVWYAAKSSDSNNSYFTQYWGMYGDQPVPADYDGDGKADFVVWRPTNGMWYVVKSGTANSYIFETLGVAGDTAVPSAYLKQIGGYVYSYDFAKVRLSPKNATGGTDLYSRNFAWSAPIFSLPGRAGLDAGFGISYNSLVWTKDPATGTVVFNADDAIVTPGFRMGFPTIEPVYYDASTQKFAYMMIGASGTRTEFRQTTNSNVFETADSSYTQLKINGSSGPDDPAESFTLIVTGTDGTYALYAWINGAYRCTKVTDRNGNYIEMAYNGNGQLTSVTDTLARVVTVNYNNEELPASVTQTWKDQNGSGSDFTRTYATFSYTTKEINTNFSGLTAIGPGNGYQLKVLDKVTFPTETNGDGPSASFTYNSYGQVWKITSKAADGHTLGYTSINLPADAGAAQSDCPRFTETRSWVENFNLNSSGVEQEAVVTNTLTENASYNVGSLSGTATKIEVSLAGHPNGAYSKTFVGSSGWMEGLTIATEDWADGTGGSERKRWTTNVWTQDDVNASYILNPRLTESAVGDTTNKLRTETDYRLVENSTVAEYGLVSEVRIKDGTNGLLYKKSTTTYNLDSAYVSRRILGLPSKAVHWGLNQSNNQLEKVDDTDYTYDEGNFNDSSLEQNISSVVRHDGDNYGASFITGRGNLTSVTRNDVLNQLSALTTEFKYNIAGAMVAQISPWTSTASRTTKVSYADNFNDATTNRNTYAYPTKLYDPAGNYSEVKYRFDVGANVAAQSPAPAGNTYGKKTTRVFDDFGRLQKQSLWKDIQGTLQEYSYSRIEYPDTGTQSKVYSTIVDTDSNGVGNTADEVLSETWTDGAGRVRLARTPMTWDSNGATLTWSGIRTEYDILGQVKRQSVPSEVNSGWTLQNDDAARGDWLWNSQDYDWKGRVTRSVPSDSNGSDGKDQVFSYDGCGCAGGEIITIAGEDITETDWQGNNPNHLGRRTQKIYRDLLGRNVKTEILNWESSVYSSSVTTYDGADRPVVFRQFKGTAVLNNDHQTTTTTYDGFGRIVTSHRPEQYQNTGTSYEYLPDGNPVTITDARGALQTFSYNSRGLVEEVEYSVPLNSGIALAPDLSFEYDSAGNRTAMTEAGGSGSSEYEYNSLSQMVAETRHIADSLPNSPLPNSGYKLEYSYELSGSLASLKDPFGEQIFYTNDRTGRLAAISGTSFGNVTSYLASATYRAWNAPKQVTFGNNVSSETDYDNALRVTDFTLSGNAAIMDRSYQYYQDGALKFMEDHLSYYNHRLFRYDNLSRVVETRTGIEAKGQAPADPPPSGLLYRQDFTFNEFGNLTGRSGIWKPGSNCGDDENFPFSHVYQNNRSVGDSYDADGRPTNKDGFWDEFDSAGRNVWHRPATAEYELQRYYDGDGQEVKKTEKVWDYSNDEWMEPTSRYYIRSTVKSGAVITEITEEGKKSQTFVYAGSDLLARQTLSAGTEPVESVKWEHWDPTRISRRTTEKDRLSPGFSGVELDPLNKNALYFCLPRQPERGQYLLNSQDYPGAQAASAMQFCNFGGILGPCDVVEGLGDNYFPFYGRSDRFAQLPFEIGPHPVRNFDNPMAVGYDAFHELYSDTFLNIANFNYADVSTNDLVSSINQYGMSDLHRLLGDPSRIGQTRQYEPLPSDADFRSSLVATLNNGDCRKFVDDFRKSAGISESLEGIFDDTVSDGGFALAPDLPSTVGGRTPYHSKTYGNHPVGINPESMKSDAYEKTQTLKRYVRTMIHEILLHRTKLNHKTAALLAFDLQTTQQKSTNPLPKTPYKGFDMDDTYAIYFNGILFGACDPQYVSQPRP